MKKALFITAVLVGIGCGIKGPPLPPLETVNDRTNNLNSDDVPALATQASGDTTKKTSGDNTTKKTKPK